MSANEKRSCAFSSILLVHTITFSVFVPRILTMAVTCFNLAVVVFLQY